MAGLQFMMLFFFVMTAKGLLAFVHASERPVNEFLYSGHSELQVTLKS